MEKQHPLDSLATTRDILMDTSTWHIICLGLLTVAGILLVNFFVWICNKYLKTQELNRKISKRRQLADTRKEIVQKQFSNVVIPDGITDKPATQIAEDVRTGRLTAVDVLHAFQRKAFEENSQLNFITEPLIEAEDHAKELDNSPEKGGLLCGVPVSIKENLRIKGYDCTSGLAMYIDEIREEDSVVVQVLKRHGAVPFVRTNLPQACYSYCCHNPIYGDTSNPQDHLRGPGGSSGGEGAILGSGASVIGIGNDLGGSVRVPAEFCGVYGLRPTVRRISSREPIMFCDGNTSVLPTHGPLARDFNSLVLVSRALMSHEMYELDRSLPCLPFDIKEYEKKGPLRIGYFTFDGVTKCQPSNVRAVEEAKSALEKQGHELVRFEFPNFQDRGKVFPAKECFATALFADRGKGIVQALNGDHADVSLKMFRITCAIPCWIFKMLNYFFGHKDRHVSALLGTFMGFKSLTEFFNNVEVKTTWQRSFMKTWLDQELDAVICPVFSTPASLKHVQVDATVAGTYTQMFNSLDYPAGVVPVTQVTQGDVENALDPKVFSPDTMIERLLLKNAKNAQGLSVGVQVATLPFKEELCLRVMRDLNTALGRA